MTTAALLKSEIPTPLVLDLLERQGNWSEEEYLALTDRTNRLVELADGMLEILPVPTDNHQGILQFLLYAFDAFFLPRGGKVRLAPLRLRIRTGKFREPDLLLLLSAADPRRQNRFWTGADLVLEVVSPDDPKRDLIVKRRDYARAGIPEYWIVNPVNETIVVLELNKKRYRRLGIFSRGDAAKSSVLAGLQISVAEVFDAQ